MKLLFSSRRLLTLGAGATLSGAVALHGCSTTADKIPTQIETCEAVQTLVASHADKFAEIRKAPRPFNSITIYQTDYQVIKNRCEIWGWGSGKFSYVCSAVSPNREVAEARYHNTIKAVSQCLDASWSSVEQPRKVGNGVCTLFTQVDNKTALTVHLIETPALFNSEWSVYASVGDYAKDI